MKAQIALLREVLKDPANTIRISFRVNDPRDGLSTLFINYFVQVAFDNEHYPSTFLAHKKIIG